MKKNPGPSKGDAGTAAYIEQRLLCLDHARDLIASAERVLASDNAYPNIAYHLAILAMEEIGKAGMLCARGVTGGAWDTSWIDRRLDDHIWKLMWAIWSPSLSGGKIDPESFKEARQFAESTHDRRMAGLYVDYEHGAKAPPRRAVRVDHATSLMKLAKACLELEETTGAPTLGESVEELEWFLATASDEQGRKMLFSRPFIQKHEELGGNTRAWVHWAREEFGKVAEAEKEHLKRELSRQASKPGQGKPKWLMKVRVQTPSHSLRQKTLNFWNDRIEAVKMRTAGPKHQDLLLEMTIHDHIKLEQLFDVGLVMSKMHLVMLNIGTGGFFWYELSGQAEAYYESVQDLEAPNMQVFIGRLSGFSKEWAENRPDGSKRQRVALEEVHLNNAIRAMVAFGLMPDHEAEPIFGQYLLGLSLLSKTDLHVSLETQARDAFLASLRRGMHQFGDLESGDAELLPSLHRVFQTIIEEEAQRTLVFGQLETPGKASLGDAVAAKRAADLYFALVAQRRWPEFRGAIGGP
ncbi:MAG: AbiV family abortive infection protein [Nitrospirota bacterium]|nr:AbiV family abortive infection protein [Nitrospirota bacterium]